MPSTQYGRHTRWKTHKMEEECVFLPIDAHNICNEINLTVMLLVMHHEWPSEACFCFNCYQHREPGSNRKVSQNFKPIRSNAERFSFHDLLWDKNLPSYPQAQEWICRCKAAMVCRWWINCRKVGRHLCTVWATPATSSQLHIFPRIVKILVVAPHNVSHYLGSSIGETTERDSWNKVDDRVCSIKKLAGVARAYPQSAYSALQCLLQQEFRDALFFDIVEHHPSSPLTVLDIELNSP